jgi:hypothetical protein
MLARTSIKVRAGRSIFGLPALGRSILLGGRRDNVIIVNYAYGAQSAPSTKIPGRKSRRGSFLNLGAIRRADTMTFVMSRPRYCSVGGAGHRRLAPAMTTTAVPVAWTKTKRIGATMERRTAAAWACATKLPLRAHSKQQHDKTGQTVIYE